jgi:hypothetical protein
MATAPASFRPAKPNLDSSETAATPGLTGITSKQKLTLPSPRRGLQLVEGAASFFVFLLWLILFAAGILVDTRPYREHISPSAVVAMEAPAATATGTAPAAQNAAAPHSGNIFKAWLVVLLCYLPLNLAWLCATSSTLGSLGSRANLSDDSANSSAVDGTNPYVSALLRGFFVYLFMTSGLLLLDETPFSSPSPGQYIRLAGFLSLFSFVISYQPQLFSALIDSAFQRIQVRGREREHESTVTESAVVSRQATETVHVDRVVAPAKTDD